MIKAGILENDIVVARSQNSADIGDIVIALLGEEATVKRLEKDKTGFYLKPENDTYREIREEFTLLGKVIGLKRSKLA